MPDWLLDAQHQVDDEVAYSIEPGHALRAVPPREIVDGGVIVVLESPHKREFNGKAGVALGPLQDPNNRRHFERCAPDLLRQATELTGIDLVSRALVIANAIQYQTSLQALKEDYRSGLDPVVRNLVWTELFEAGGGDDLLERLDRYNPALVFLAPTKTVAPLLRDVIKLARRNWPSLLVNEHPSRWWGFPPIVVECIEGRN